MDFVWYFLSCRACIFKLCVLQMFFYWNYITWSSRVEMFWVFNSTSLISKEQRHPLLTLNKWKICFTRVCKCRDEDDFRLPSSLSVEAQGAFLLFDDKDECTSTATSTSTSWRFVSHELKMMIDGWGPGGLLLLDDKDEYVSTPFSFARSRWY